MEVAQVAVVVGEWVVCHHLLAGPQWWQAVEAVALQSNS